MKEIDAALYTQLTIPATTLYGLIATKMFDTLAPKDTLLPYGVFNVQAGGYLNDTPTDAVDILYLVKGLGATAGAANAVDSAIGSRLHNATFTVVGWTLVSCMRETEIGFSELVNAAPVFHKGALYRIRIAK